MTQRLPGSNARLIIFLLNGAGYAAGSAGTALAAGETSNAWSLDIANGIDITRREIGRREHIGAGGKLLGNVAVGDNATNQVNITVDVDDDALFAGLQGTLLDTTTNTQFTIGTPYTVADQTPSIGVIVSEPAPLREGGARSYRHEVWSTGQAVITRNAIAADPTAPTQATIQFVPSVSGIWFTGESIGDLLIGAPSDEADSIVFYTDYPIHVVTLISDGIETDIVSAYTPVSNVVTDGATPNWFFRNGAAQALTSMTVATKTAVMASVGTSGDVNVLVHKVLHTFAG